MACAHEPQAARFRKAGPTFRNPLQAAKQRSCGYERHPPPQTVPRSGTDISTMILRTVHRSRFAEPKECVSVFAYPQRRSFGACSGFQIDTCPIGTRRCSYCHTVTEVASGKKLRITVSLRSTTKEPQAARFREAGPTIRNPLQAAKQRSCGYEQPPLHNSSAKRD